MPEAKVPTTMAETRPPSATTWGLNGEGEQDLAERSSSRHVSAVGQRGLAVSPQRTAGTPACGAFLSRVTLSRGRVAGARNAPAPGAGMEECRVRMHSRQVPRRRRCGRSGPFAAAHRRVRLRRGVCSAWRQWFRFDNRWAGIATNVAQPLKARRPQMDVVDGAGGRWRLGC
jgi:hypothetical protein